MHAEADLVVGANFVEMLLQDMQGAKQRAGRGACTPSMPTACSRLSMSWMRFASGVPALSSKTLHKTG